MSAPEIRHLISQNTLSFLAEKIFEFKVGSCVKIRSIAFDIPDDVDSHLRLVSMVDFHKVITKTEAIRRKCISTAEENERTQMTSQFQVSSLILNVNISQDTQYFWEKGYQHVK